MKHQYPISITPLGHAREWLRENIEEGVPCPCCTQYAKVYRRRVNAGMARSLVLMYKAGRTDWVHVPTVIGSRSREEGKLRYWGLVEESTEPREDGGRAGWWRVTPRGEQFVLGEVRIARHARVYDGRCLSLDHSEMVGIIDCLGSKFNYNELMNQ